VPHVKRAAAILLSWPALARAHSGSVDATPDGSSYDGSTFLVWALLAVSALLYAAGLLRLRAHVRARRELWWRAAAFATGWVFLAVALLSPLDSAAGRSFALHMVQHEVLMLVAAPLLVLGRGLPTFLWALPHGARLVVGHTTKQHWLRSAWETLTSPLSAWLLHALALWLWHVPRFFNAAVLDATVHDWQHASFLVTALIFWHALLRTGRQAARGMALVYLFTTTIHTGVLGALLTFAPRPLYATLDRGLRDSAFTLLEDQQLGGLIMWVPGALVYVGVALLLAVRWLRALEGPERAARRRAGGPPGTETARP
jgi:putative membrane protein